MAAVLPAPTGPLPTPNTPMLRAKMRVQEVAQIKDSNGKIDCERVTLCAVYSNDPKSPNHDWCRWTPAANFTITISNQGAIGKLSSGHEYYIDFTPASDA